MDRFGFSRDIPMLAEAREKKRGLIIPLEILVFFALFFVASEIESLPVGACTFAWLVSDGSIISAATEALMGGDLSGFFSEVSRVVEEMPAWVMLVSLFATALMTGVCILFCRVIQKRGVGSIGFRRGHVIREYLIGALIGAGMISAVVLIGVLLGNYEITFAKVNVGLLILFFLGYFVQGMSEEVLCRGCFMVSLSRRNPLWASVLISSVMFALLHALNPGFGLIPFVNVALSGAIFAVYILKRGNIWGACAMHSFWNFFLGNVFGISVSGTNADTGASIMVTEAVADGSRFGLEGTYVCTAVLLAVLVLMIFVMRPAQDME